MPIANCIISRALTPGGDNPVDKWSQQSGVAADLLTINFVKSDAQLGLRYDVMATLQLPTAWTKSDAAVIQLSLAAVLRDYFSVVAAQVHVITQWVESGDVVENGELRSW